MTFLEHFRMGLHAGDRGVAEDRIEALEDLGVGIQVDTAIDAGQCRQDIVRSGFLTKLP